MNSILRRLLIGIAVLVLLLGIVGAVLYHWTGQDDFRDRVAAQASAALGVPVTLGRVEIDWFPVPAVALNDVSVQARPPVTVQRIEARPQWAELLHGRLVVQTLVVRGAVLSETALEGLLALVQSRVASPSVAASAAAGTPGSDSPMRWVPRRTVLDGFSWTSARGVTSVADAQARTGDDGLPQEISVKLLKGPFESAKASIQRDAADWLVDVEIGGGTVKGKLQFAPAPAAGKEMVLQGRLDTRGVEVSALTAPSRPLTGRIEATTSLVARASRPAGLVEALHTSTHFSVDGAVVHGVDLVKAVRTVGLSRGGETALSTLSGDVTTQGRSVQVSNLAAKSGVLNATGEVAISSAQALSGRVVVDVTAGTIGSLTGIPLAVGGTLSAPEVSLSRSAMLGAALGTAIMPGVGTGAGAKLGERIGRGFSGLFGGKK